MEQVFDQCQQHEVKRLTFLKEALLDIKRHLNLTENQRLELLTLQLLFMSQADAAPGSPGTIIARCSSLDVIR